MVRNSAMLRAIFKNNRGDTSGIGTAYPFGAPEFIPGFQSGSFNSIFSCMCMFFTSLFVTLYFFLLAIVLYVFLRLMNYDYPCGIFKLFLDISITCSTGMNSQYSVSTLSWFIIYICYCNIQFLINTIITKKVVVVLRKVGI